MCKQHCLNGGRCLLPNYCHCRKGYTGLTCAVKVSALYRSYAATIQSPPLPCASGASGSKHMSLKEEHLLLFKEPRQSFRRAASWERGEKCFFIVQQIKRLFFIQMVGGIFEAFRKYLISDVLNRLLGIYLSKTLMLNSVTLIHKVHTGAQGTLILRGNTLITLKMLIQCSLWTLILLSVF